MLVYIILSYYNNMSILKKWNDIITLKEGDTISYKDKPYTITEKSYDQDYGGAQYTFTLKDDKGKSMELTINILGDIKGDFSDSNLSNNNFKKISSGGKRRTKCQRRCRTKCQRRRRTHKTLRIYK